MLPGLALFVGCGSSDEVCAPDRDGDGYGSMSAAAVACGPGVHNRGDCDDADPAVSPVATERCDGIDNDCGGGVDDGAAQEEVSYADADGDGYGDDTLPHLGCPVPPGHALLGGDCDDGDAGVSPGTPEACGDAVDEDCDGVAPPCGLAGTVPVGAADVVLTGAADEHAGTVVSMGPACDGRAGNAISTWSNTDQGIPDSGLLAG